jgi:hypothetical protein
LEIGERSRLRVRQVIYAYAGRYLSIVFSRAAGLKVVRVADRAGRPITNVEDRSRKSFKAVFNVGVTLPRR